MSEAHSPQGSVCFGVFQADFRAGELRKRGIKIKLQEQPLQILQMLLEHPGEIVTREELRQKIWPADTFVDFEQGLYNAVRRLRDALKDSADKPRFVETLSRRGYRFIGTINSTARRIQSLAVLPLENLSHDPEQEYFAEGLTEALITTLAKIGELRVVSRTSAMQYKGVRRPLREIAQELRVDGIIEGTVLRAGQRVRISTQLVDARTDTHLWAENYDRDLRDILALHSEVAHAIAQQVQVKLTPYDHAHLAHPRPVDPGAYEAYLKGRYYWNRRPAGFKQAIQHFQESIDKDPAYPAPYAGLADCFSALNAFGLVPASEGCIKAKGLALKALEIDHSLAEGHTSLAYASMYHYDFSTAEKEFERAIELNPRYLPAHHLFGWYLCIMDRYEEAYAELQRAIRLDPIFSLSNAFLGIVYFYGRRYDQAIKQCQKTLELDPNSGPAQAFLGWAYRCKSLFEPGIAALRKACDLWPGSTPIGMLGEAYAAAGRRDEALKVLEQLDQLSKQRYVTPYVVSRIYATLGQKDEAFHWLEIAYQQQAEWMVLLKVDPCFDNLRPDPRFQDLLLRMNFPSSLEIRLPRLAEI
jgi:TolB-like protein/Flp pilus assembly protein TadD